MNQVKDFLEYILNVFKIWVIVQPWQRGLIVRNGKRIKEVSGGIYFKLPYFDSVYIQEVRLRVSDVAMQTLTSKDGKTITINSAIGYSITNLKTLYKTLFHPESTIQNIAMSEIAKYIYDHNVDEINPDNISQSVLNHFNEIDYGLDIKYLKITNFAVVRTYRLIQDGSWNNEGLDMSEKK